MADSFQLVIDDTSPVLAYYPFSDSLGVPDLQAGWNPYYTGSGFVSSLGQMGSGDTQHITSLDGAVFSIQWFGSDLELYGNVTGSATYDLVLDGQTNHSISAFSSDQTLLAEYTSLPAANHTLSLVVHNSGNSTSALIVIDKAVVTVNTASPNVTAATTVIDDTEIAFKGEWSFEQDPTISPGDGTFHASSNAGDQAFFSFNGTAVAVNGIRDFSAGHYSVKLDNETVQFDAQASWREPATLFFSAGLDPDVTHHITIINNEDRMLEIGSFNVTTVSGQYPMTSAASSSGLHGGTIAAVVVAAVLGCLVACLLFFCVWRRRRRLAVLRRRRMLSPSRKADDIGGVLDIGPDADTAEDDGDRQDSKSKVYTKEGSISFTLDLPIQTRASRTSSQRTKSDNGIQILPRSPTVSLVRPQPSHHRDSSRGALLLDVPSDSTPYLDVEEQSPFHVSFHMRSREGSEFIRCTSGQDQSTGSRNGNGNPQGQGDGLQLTPITPLQPPRVNVISSSPHPQHVEISDEGREGRYSFLDISTPELSLQEAPSVANHSSSSSSTSPRSRPNRLSGESERRRISLVSAFNYHHSAPAFMTVSSPPQPPPLPPIPMQFSRSASMLGPVSTIRPLPRIPHTPAIPERPQSSPSPPNPLFPPALTLQTHLPGPRTQTSASTPASGPSPHANIYLQTPSVAAAQATAASPTDSIPITVSDIHFRHSSDGTDEGAGGASESRRTSDLPPHPPLPTRGFASPFIMQKLLGSQPVLGSPGLPGGMRFEPVRRQEASSRPGTGSRGGHEDEEPPSPDGPRFAPGPSSLRPFWRS